MYNVRYINPETEDLLNYVPDYAEQRERYRLKTLSSEYLQLLKRNLPFTYYSKGKLSDNNPLLPKGIFDSKDKDVVFIKFDNQKESDLGFVMLGEFHSNDSYTADAPDSVSMYLAKKDRENNIVLWRNLKTTPGFEDVYKFGNSFYVQKQRIVPGASGDNRGAISINTNSYELLQATRIFWDEANKQGTSANKLIEGIKNNNYSFMDIRPIYKKSDRWSTKMNELASGKLENVMFTASQINDADFLHTNTVLGEQYLLQKKLDNRVFETITPIFKRNSGKNRVIFLRDFDVMKKDYFSRIADGEALEPYGMNFLTQRIKEFNSEHFRGNLDTFSQLNLIFNNMDVKGKNSYLIKKLQDSKEVSGRDIRTLISDKTDYLGKSKMLEDLLYDFKNKKGGEKKEFDNYKFDKKELEKMVNNINTSTMAFESYIIQKMDERIDSKIGAALNGDFEIIQKEFKTKDGKSYKKNFVAPNKSNKYMKYLYNVKKGDDYDETMGAIERDLVREFFDKYNEKIDLYELMVSERRKSSLSEIEAVADRVQFKYKNNIVKPENLEDVLIHTKNYFKTEDFTKDADLKWGYYKARIKVGKTKFDSLTIKDRLKLARKYIEDNKELFERLSKKSSLGRYDDIDEFRKLPDDVKYDYVTNAGLSRTNDKILGRININDSMDINGGIVFGNKIHNIHIRLDKNDGFSKNDYIKEIINDRQAAFKKLDLATQIEIENKSRIFRKVYKLNQLVHKADSMTKDEEEHKKLLAMQSFLQGQTDKYTKGRAPIWGLKDGELIFTKGMKDFTGIERLDKYNRIYDEITKYLKSKHNSAVGYALYDTYRDYKKESMRSLSELKADLLLNNNLKNKIDNTTFMAIINNDQIINTSGASKQQSLIKGNSYLGHLGFAQPGLAWNKVTQRTYQAQDVLGEQTIGKGADERTVSEVNAEIIKRLNFSGVNKRVGKYTTEELYKEAINRINRRAGLNNTTYKRGETYKTFAIGDVNTKIGNGLNSFTASFQEGMTAARSMILTTNSIRNKQFNLNIEELDFEKLGYDKLEIHNKLMDAKKREEILSKILNKDLYDTIAGREKYESILTRLSDKYTLDMLDGSYNGMQRFYNEFARQLEIENPIKFDYRDTKENRMKITRAIYNLMSNLRDRTGAVAKPTTDQGKNVITTEMVKTRNELKPEYGFSIKDVNYNAQTRNIEVMLENIGINTQGSKGQTTGAKFTISEIYDFLKLRSKGREVYIDAIFNNKAEKRTQTGMLIHTALQTVFTNVYESAGTEGVLKLKENMSDLLSDMNVMIRTNEHGYTIDERYLTRKYRSGDTMTLDEFEAFMKHPTINTGKMFTENGKKILEDLISKYSTRYTVDGKEVKASPHFGVINAMNKAYVQTFKELGKDLIPLVASDAQITGYANNTESNFGKGNFLLLKLASERVNSTSSKKKESGLKISREMLEMLRISGYNELSDYVDRKNTKRLTNYLGDVYNNMNNADILREAYKHKKNLDISQLNQAMSESLRNGIMFNLDSIDKEDYLLDETDIYLKYNRFLEESALGKEIKSKNLDRIVDGKLSDNINVVVNDSRINQLTKDIKKSVDVVRSYYENLAEKNDNFSSRNKFIAKTYADIQSLNILGMNDPKNRINQLIESLDNPYIKKELSVLDRYRTASFLKLVKQNADKSYSLEQLRTIMETGNVLTSVNLSYDIDEATEQIVPSRAFSKLRNIAKKNFEYSNLSQSAINMREKFTNKDKTLIEDIYAGMLDYYSGKTEFSNVEMYDDLIRELNFKNYKLNVKNNDRIENLQNKMRKAVSDDYLKKITIEGLNNFLQENYSKLGKTKDELNAILDKNKEEIAKMDKELNETKADIYKELIDSDITQAIKSKLHNTIFGDESGKKDYLINKRTFIDYFGDKAEEQFESGFNLLSEYISAPSGSESLFTKKGPITAAQKYKVNSSFVANPLEGSNLLNKFEDLMFYKVKDKYSLEKNLTEFQEFLGADIVNENLFKDDNGINMLDMLDNKGPSGFEKGLEKAREVFSKNLANISEVTITNKKYMDSFRDNKFEWKDVYDKKDFKGRGFVREIGFFSRHPQQTINHMGPVLNITVDSTRNDIKNRFARASLTYLPQEKNNAGVVTLGKRTMLLRRGD